MIGTVAIVVGTQGAAMNSRERLVATLRGEPVDRPAVSFYEIGGFDINPDDPDEFNIYNAPSWRPLIELAESQTDLLRMREPRERPDGNPCRTELMRIERCHKGDSRFTRTVIKAGGRTLTSQTRRDREVDTVWNIEHPIKNREDLLAFLELPDEFFASAPDIQNLLDTDRKVGDRGIVMIDTADPLGAVCMLFKMEDYLVAAMTEPGLFHRLLEKLAPHYYARTETISAAWPGHLWRICGSEFATEPYLPPRLFEEYAVRYMRPMIDTITRNGGFARVHCHGRIRSVLPHIVAMGATALDPIEPPPQGDVELAFVRKEYGDRLVLFGNLEARDIENMEPDAFEKVVAAALRDGTSGSGKGFVLMPSAAPCGRTITSRTMKNYEMMIRLVQNFQGVCDKPPAR